MPVPILDGLGQRVLKPREGADEVPRHSIQRSHIRGGCAISRAVYLGYLMSMRHTGNTRIQCYPSSAADIINLDVARRSDLKSSAPSWQ